jgi:broad specificity phosphatase PhoE
MAALVHLVRHADVDNPQHIVYGSSPGYGLSPYGLEQARRVGRYLGPRAVVAIWSSPLEPALRTAEEIAGRSGVPVRVDDDLRDWVITDRWRGQTWMTLPGAFPGELEAYLEDPSEVRFAGETLDEVADRIASVARRLDRDHPHGDVVIVSHQDPVQAGRLRLTGSTLSGLHEGTPESGTVITLRPGVTWREETVWGPGEAPRFGERSDLRVVAAADGPHQPTSA